MLRNASTSIFRKPIKDKDPLKIFWVLCGINAHDVMAGYDVSVYMMSWRVLVIGMRYSTGAVC